jgi:pimeloyl-ACP methyl ester carboxylesterase
MAPLAECLAERFRVLEPFQRGSGGRPLSVHQHVSDLASFLEVEADAAPVGIVGHSWGAMLALCFASAFPDLVAALALVGCGTFDEGARAEFEERIEQRMSPELRAEMDRVTTRAGSPDDRLRRLGDFLLPIYSHSLATRGPDPIEYDQAAHEESWSDMLRLQKDERFLARFEAIEAPVLMLHGAQDPHPGEMIHASLLPHLPQLEYREWEKCGHYPWLETDVRKEFEATLVRWLLQKLTV